MSPRGRCSSRKAGSVTSFFVIMEGEVEVTRRGKSIARYGGGDFLGEIALIEDVPRTATVTAKTPLRFFVMIRQAFFGFWTPTPRSNARSYASSPSGS